MLRTVPISVVTTISSSVIAAPRAISAAPSTSQPKSRL